MAREEKGQGQFFSASPVKAPVIIKECQLEQKKQLTMLATEGLIEGMDHDW
jgi:hypothetical protein